MSSFYLDYLLDGKFDDNYASKDASKAYIESSGSSRKSIFKDMLFDLSHYNIILSMHYNIGLKDLDNDISRFNEESKLHDKVCLFILPIFRCMRN